MATNTLMSCIKGQIHDNLLHPWALTNASSENPYTNLFLFLFHHRFHVRWRLTSEYFLLSCLSFSAGCNFKMCSCCHWVNHATFPGECATTFSVICTIWLLLLRQIKHSTRPRAVLNGARRAEVHQHLNWSVLYVTNELKHGSTQGHLISSTPEWQEVYQLLLHNSTRVSEQGWNIKRHAVQLQTTHTALSAWWPNNLCSSKDSSVQTGSQLETELCPSTDLKSGDIMR